MNGQLLCWQAFGFYGKIILILFLWIQNTKWSIFICWWFRLEGWSQWRSFPLVINVMSIKSGSSKMKSGRRKWCQVPENEVRSQKMKSGPSLNSSDLSSQHIPLLCAEPGHHAKVDTQTYVAGWENFRFQRIF